MGKARPFDVDRGVLNNGRAFCGVCRNVFVRRKPRNRAEGKREGWRYVEPWGWVCATCAQGCPGVAVQERKRRARPKRIQRDTPKPRTTWVDNVTRRGGGRHALDPEGAGGFSKPTDVLRKLGLGPTKGP